MGKAMFIYRLKCDTGFAPCVDYGLFTLACCKGGHFRNGRPVRTGLRHRIGEYRKRYRDDDIFLLGTYGGKLLFAAEITKIMCMTDYYRSRMTDSEKRIDDIYDVNENGELVRNGRITELHSKGSDESEKDKLGDYVLISDKFTYFGTEAKVIDELGELFPKNRETKTYYSGYGDEGYEEESFSRIMNYLERNKYLDLGVCADPHDPKWEGRDLK